jgi:2-polyprenyl-6-methoxyphenol hydroxylase-like FAD-dependent oxidoreductase
VSDSEASVDVTIVGAGPSGLVAAIRLLELGLTIEIVDASRQPAQESRAALMHASTVEILAELGLSTELVEHGRRIDAITLADRGRVLAARQVLKLTDRITRVSLLRSRPARALRNAAIRTLTRIPLVRRALVGSVSGLNRSPLH